MDSYIGNSRSYYDGLPMASSSSSALVQGTGGPPSSQVNRGSSAHDATTPHLRETTSSLQEIASHLYPGSVQGPSQGHPNYNVDIFSTAHSSRQYSPSVVPTSSAYYYSGQNPVQHSHSFAPTHSRPPDTKGGGLPKSLEVTRVGPAHLFSSIAPTESTQIIVSRPNMAHSSVTNSHRSRVDTPRAVADSRYGNPQSSQRSGHSKSNTFHGAPSRVQSYSAGPSPKSSSSMGHSQQATLIKAEEPTTLSGSAPSHQKDHHLSSHFETATAPIPYALARQSEDPFFYDTLENSFARIQRVENPWAVKVQQEVVCAKVDEVDIQRRRNEAYVEKKVAVSTTTNVGVERSCNISGERLSSGGSERATLVNGVREVQYKDNSSYRTHDSDSGQYESRCDSALDLSVKTVRQTADSTSFGNIYQKNVVRSPPTPAKRMSSIALGAPSNYIKSDPQNADPSYNSVHYMTNSDIDSALALSHKVNSSSLEYNAYRQSPTLDINGISSSKLSLKRPVDSSSSSSSKLQRLDTSSGLAYPPYLNNAAKMAIAKAADNQASVKECKPAYQSSFERHKVYNSPTPDYYGTKPDGYEHKNYHSALTRAHQNKSISPPSKSPFQGHFPQQASSHYNTELKYANYYNIPSYGNEKPAHSKLPCKNATKKVSEHLSHVERDATLKKEIPYTLQSSSGTVSSSPFETTIEKHIRNCFQPNTKNIPSPQDLRITGSILEKRPFNYNTTEYLPKPDNSKNIYLDHVKKYDGIQECNPNINTKYPKTSSAEVTRTNSSFDPKRYSVNTGATTTQATNPFEDFHDKLIYSQPTTEYSYNLLEKLKFSQLQELNALKKEVSHPERSESKVSDSVVVQNEPATCHNKVYNDKGKNPDDVALIKSAIPIQLHVAENIGDATQKALLSTSSTVSTSEDAKCATLTNSSLSSTIPSSTLSTVSSTSAIVPNTPLKDESIPLELKGPAESKEIDNKVSPEDIGSIPITSKSEIPILIPLELASQHKEVVSPGVVASIPITEQSGIPNTENNENPNTDKSEIPNTLELESQYKEVNSPSVSKLTTYSPPSSSSPNDEADKGKLNDTQDVTTPNNKSIVKEEKIIDSDVEKALNETKETGKECPLVKKELKDEMVKEDVDKVSSPLSESRESCGAVSNDNKVMATQSEKSALLKEEKDVKIDVSDISMDENKKLCDVQKNLEFSDKNCILESSEKSAEKKCSEDVTIDDKNINDKICEKSIENMPQSSNGVLNLTSINNASKSDNEEALSLICKPEVAKLTLRKDLLPSEPIKSTIVEKKTIMTDSSTTAFFSAPLKPQTESVIMKSPWQSVMPFSVSPPSNTQPKKVVVNKTETVQTFTQPLAPPHASRSPFSSRPVSSHSVPPYSASSNVPPSSHSAPPTRSSISPHKSPFPFTSNLSPHVTVTRAVVSTPISSPTVPLAHSITSHTSNLLHHPQVSNPVSQPSSFSYSNTYSHYTQNSAHCAPSPSPHSSTSHDTYQLTRSPHSPLHPPPQDSNCSYPKMQMHFPHSPNYPPITANTSHHQPSSATTSTVNSDYYRQKVADKTPIKSTHAGVASYTTRPGVYSQGKNTQSAYSAKPRSQQHQLPASHVAAAHSYDYSRLHQVNQAPPKPKLDPQRPREGNVYEDPVPKSSLNGLKHAQPSTPRPYHGSSYEYPTQYSSQYQLPAPNSHTNTSNSGQSYPPVAHSQYPPVAHSPYPPMAHAPSKTPTHSPFPSQSYPPTAHQKVTGSSGYDTPYSKPPQRPAHSQANSSPYSSSYPHPIHSEEAHATTSVMQSNPYKGQSYPKEYPKSYGYPEAVVTKSEYQYSYPSQAEDKMKGLSYPGTYPPMQPPSRTSSPRASKGRYVHSSVSPNPSNNVSPLPTRHPSPAPSHDKIPPYASVQAANQAQAQAQAHASRNPPLNLSSQPRRPESQGHHYPVTTPQQYSPSYPTVSPSPSPSNSVRPTTQSYPLTSQSHFAAKQGSHQYSSSQYSPGQYYPSRNVPYSSQQYPVGPSACQTNPSLQGHNSSTYYSSSPSKGYPPNIHPSTTTYAHTYTKTSPSNSAPPSHQYPSNSQSYPPTTYTQSYPHEPVQSYPPPKQAHNSSAPTSTSRSYPPSSPAYTTTYPQSTYAYPASQSYDSSTAYASTTQYATNVTQSMPYMSQATSHYNQPHSYYNSQPTKNSGHVPYPTCPPVNKTSLPEGKPAHFYPNFSTTSKDTASKENRDHNSASKTAADKYAPHSQAYPIQTGAYGHSTEPNASNVYGTTSQNLIHRKSGVDNGKYRYTQSSARPLPFPSKLPGHVPKYMKDSSAPQAYGKNSDREGFIELSNKIAHDTTGDHKPPLLLTKKSSDLGKIALAEKLQKKSVKDEGTNLESDFDSKFDFFLQDLSTNSEAMTSKKSRILGRRYIQKLQLQTAIDNNEVELPDDPVIEESDDSEPETPVKFRGKFKSIKDKAVERVILTYASHSDESATEMIPDDDASDFEEELIKEIKAKAKKGRKGKCKTEIMDLYQSKSKHLKSPSSSSSSFVKREKKNSDFTLSSDSDSASRYSTSSSNSSSGSSNSNSSNSSKDSASDSDSSSEDSRKRKLSKGRKVKTESSNSDEEFVPRTRMRMKSSKFASRKGSKRKIKKELSSDSDSIPKKKKKNKHSSKRRKNHIDESDSEDQMKRNTKKKGIKKRKEDSSSESEKENKPKENEITEELIKKKRIESDDDNVEVAPVVKEATVEELLPLGDNDEKVDYDSLIDENDTIIKKILTLREEENNREDVQEMKSWIEEVSLEMVKLLDDLPGSRWKQTWKKPQFGDEFYRGWQQELKEYKISTVRTPKSLVSIPPVPVNNEKGKKSKDLKKDKTTPALCPAKNTRSKSGIVKTSLALIVKPKISRPEISSVMERFFEKVMGGPLEVTSETKRLPALSPFSLYAPVKTPTGLTPTPSVAPSMLAASDNSDRDSLASLRMDLPASDSVPVARKHSIANSLIKKLRKKYNEGKMNTQWLNKPRSILEATNRPQLLPTPGVSGFRSSSYQALKLSNFFSKDSVKKYKKTIDDLAKNGIKDYAPLLIPSRTRTKSKIILDSAALKAIFGAAPQKDSVSPPKLSNKLKKTPLVKLEEIILPPAPSPDPSSVSSGTPIDLLYQNCDEEYDSELRSEHGSLTSDFNLLKCLQKSRKRLRKFKKFRSGFDYIPKKKKKVKPEEEHLVTTKRKLPVRRRVHWPEEARGDVATEVRNWVTNKGLGETILHKAARLRYHDVVIYCLESQDFNVNIRDNAGYTPLHEACNRGHLDIAQALCAHGAFLNAPGYGGKRPLHEAIENGFPELARMLVAYGADPSLATYAGQSCLCLATDAMCRVLLGDYLLDLKGEKTRICPIQGPVNAFDLEEQGSHFFSGLDPKLLQDPPDEGKKKSPPEASPEDFAFEASDKILPASFRLRGTPHRYVLLQELLETLDLTDERGLIEAAGAIETVHMTHDEFSHSFVSCLFGYRIPEGGAATVTLVKFTQKVLDLLEVEVGLLSG